MEKDRNFQKEKIGKSGYINENCYLAKTLNYSPYKRCQYCELKFRDCLFLHYQVTSLILIIYLFILSFLIEGKVSELLIISVFVLVIVYGYFLNRSTNKIIQANFAQRKANEALEELNKKLEEQVEQRTEKLRMAYEKLEKLDKLKSEFISITSHQLRTPLSGLKGFLSMLLEGDFGELDQIKRDVIKDLLRSAERLVRTVNLFLDISRIEVGKLRVEKKKVSIENLITEVIQEFIPEIEKRGLTIQFKKPEKSLGMIKMDRDKIKDAILNLVDNSIKYTKKGEIIIKAGIKDKMLEVAVEDTGMGIAKEDLPQLFAKFSRGSNRPPINPGGSGLGLFVVKKIVDLHDGEVWAQSEGLGKGSKFIFKIPV